MPGTCQLRDRTASGSGQRLIFEDVPCAGGPFLRVNLPLTGSDALWSRLDEPDRRSADLVVRLLLMPCSRRTAF